MKHVYLCLQDGVTVAVYSSWSRADDWLDRMILSGERGYYTVREMEVWD